MEILKINENVLKIVLCKSEALEYDLNEKTELDAAGVKKSFSKLLNKAKKEVGFNYAGGNVVAEIFTGKDGGCEIFVSHIKEEIGVYKDKSEPKIKPQKQLYVTEKFENVLAAFKRLKCAKYEGESALYYDTSQGKYYIILEGVSKKDLKFAFVCEYLRPVKSSIMTYMADSLNLICSQNAHEVISALA